MKTTFILLLSFTLSFFAACSSGSAAVKETQQEKINLSSDRNTVPGEYLVTVNEGKNESDLRKDLSGIVILSLSNVSRDIYLVKVGVEVGIDMMEKKAKGSSVIKKVQPNFIYRSNKRKGSAQ